MTPEQDNPEPLKNQRVGRSRAKPETISDFYPHFVRLPRHSISPTGSVYKYFDIVHQTRVVWTFAEHPSIVRSTQPFTLCVRVGNKIKEISSKVKL